MESSDLLNEIHKKVTDIQIKVNEIDITLFGSHDIGGVIRDHKSLGASHESLKKVVWWGGGVVATVVFFKTQLFSLIGIKL